MRRFILFATVVLIANLSASAQPSHPSAEVFGGYAYMNTKVFDRDSLHGWGASVAGNLSANWGFAAEFSGHYGNSATPSRVFEFPPLPPITIPGIDLNTSKYLFLFGPHFSVRGNKVTGFAHVLLGGAKTNLKSTFRNVGVIAFPLEDPSFGQSETGFAMAIGGGVDVNAGKNFAVRILQVDYVPDRSLGQWQHNVRAQFGIVFKFD